MMKDTVESMTDLQRFSRAVKLKGFQPFQSAAEALENANAISEHAMSETLQHFLEGNLPKASKKSTFSLGVIDPGLGTAIANGLGYACRSDDTVREIIRGCRLHLESFVKGLQSSASVKAQLGLGHSYSRSKVKFNPARSDNMIIQSIALLDQLDKDVNTFAMRVREWYSWHFPELKDIVKDNIMFARAASVIQDKNSLIKKSTSGESSSESDDKIAKLTEIVVDKEVAEQVVSAAKTSMGMECSAVDMINIVNFTTRMVSLAEYRKQLSLYLTDKMSIVAPNLSALIGDTVAARLISKVRFHSLVYELFILVFFFNPMNHLNNLVSLFLGWFADKSSQVSRQYGTDSRSRKGSLSCTQDKGKHTQVWFDLSFDLYRPG